MLAPHVVLEISRAAEALATAWTGAGVDAQVRLLGVLDVRLAPSVRTAALLTREWSLLQHRAMANCQWTAFYSWTV